jgi:glutamate dehydrogenase
MALETGFPDDAEARPFLDAYFPRRLQVFGEHFADHPLRREIIGTAAVNALVNNAGIAFLSRVMAASKAGLGEVMAAYFQVDRETDAVALREKVCEAALSAAAEQQALLEIEEQLETLTLERLDGKEATAAAAQKALQPIRARLPV